MENPIIKLIPFDEYKLLIDIKYNNINFFDSQEKTGYELGLSEGKTIEIVINNNNIIYFFEKKKNKINLWFNSYYGDKIYFIGHKNEKLGELLKRFFEIKVLDLQ